MPKMEANGIELYYESLGEGQPVLLIAGFSADYITWAGFSGLLAETFQVIVYDNRGVGQSDSPDLPYTIEMMADDAAALLEGLNIPQADVLGHSMGGSIAQLLALRHPEKVRKLMLFNTFPKINHITYYTFTATQGLIEAQTPVGNIAQTLLSWLFSENFLSSATNVRRKIEVMSSNPYPQTQVGFIRQFEALKGFDSRDLLSDLRVPTFILAGEKDLLSPLSDTKVLADAIPTAELLVIPESGHMSHMEFPSLCAKLVREFLFQPH